MSEVGIRSSFTFEGFSPSADLRSYCDQVFYRVESKSPSESVKEASVTKKESGYEGAIKVVSPSGTFIVTSNHTQLNDLIDDLYAKFSEEISVWSRSREL